MASPKPLPFSRCVKAIPGLYSSHCGSYIEDAAITSLKNASYKVGTIPKSLDALLTAQATLPLLLRQRQPRPRLSPPRPTTLPRQECFDRNRNCDIRWRRVYVRSRTDSDGGSEGMLADGKLDTFTLRAVGQDDFSDVAVPDAPVQPATAPNASTNRSAGSA